jgi:hypothetical protein
MDLTGQEARVATATQVRAALRAKEALPKQQLARALQDRDRGRMALRGNPGDTSTQRILQTVEEKRKSDLWPLNSKPCSQSHPFNILHSDF